jgi:Ser/Thr protein kinase RdoA (MazF antagonist)
MDEPFPEKISRLAKHFHSYWKRLNPLTALVHADLHFGNLKWSPWALRPIDFDDCGVAPLAYDLAVPASCFYGPKTSEDVLSDFLSGYEETGPRAVSLSELRLFMGVRKIWMFGWCGERPEIFSKALLRTRYEAFTRQLDSFL